MGATAQVKPPQQPYQMKPSVQDRLNRDNWLTQNNTSAHNFNYSTSQTSTMPILHQPPQSLEARLHLNQNPVLIDYIMLNDLLFLLELLYYLIELLSWKHINTDTELYTTYWDWSWAWTWTNYRFHTISLSENRFTMCTEFLSSKTEFQQRIIWKGIFYLCEHWRGAAWLNKNQWSCCTKLLTNGHSMSWRESRPIRLDC